MEESGHYYTVYYTSLAAGFNEKLAYRHAVLAQMPDEVAWFDAAHIHILYCKTPASRALSSSQSSSSSAGQSIWDRSRNFLSQQTDKVMRPVRDFFSDKETNLGGGSETIPNDWRHSVEYNLHALAPNDAGKLVRSSDFQRRKTTEQLDAEHPASLKFGMLLHRLGDSYSHSRIENSSEMYTVSTRDSRWDCVPVKGLKDDNLGHGTHLTFPDNPLLRQGIFFLYLFNLYEVMQRKLRQYPALRRNPATAMSFEGLKARYQNLFSEILYSPSNYMKSPSLKEQLMEAIRRDCQSTLGVRMESYRPERYQTQTLQQFLDQHRELDDLHIGEDRLKQTLESMRPELTYEEQMSNFFQSMTPEQLKAWQQEQAAKAGINLNNINMNNLWPGR
ncbi:hypothetical protein JMG10_20265 [Nostoc ellipsosporum NOK]|jgi:hypothetical protein|nr:hypothetical protein [Nostoc ellipsosporum NOK]